MLQSIGSFLGEPRDLSRWTRGHLEVLARLLAPGSSSGIGIQAPDPPGAFVVYRRNPRVKGPVSVFGYDYPEDHLGREQTARLALLRFAGLRGGGSEYAYEALNFVDGKRTVRQIRDELSAVYGPVPVAAVAEYLQALEAVGLIVPVASDAVARTSIESPHSWAR